MTSAFPKFWGPTAFLNKIYYHKQLPLWAVYVVTMLGSEIAFKKEKREHVLSVRAEQGYSLMHLLHIREAFIIVVILLIWPKQYLLCKNSTFKARLGMGTCRRWSGFDSTGALEPALEWACWTEEEGGNYHFTSFNSLIPESWYYLSHCTV